MKVREIVQGAMAVVIAPLAGAMLFLGMAMVPLSASRSWLVFSHMAKNAALLLPRLPGALWSLWIERSKAPVQERMSIPMLVTISIFGLPFIAVMLLLDDYA